MLRELKPRGENMAHKVGRGALVALLAAGSLTLGALPSMSAPANIRATSSNSWTPKTSHVQKGKKAVWKNPTFVDHNIRAYGGNWTLKRLLGPDDSFARRFKKVGTFKFLCKIHGSTRKVDGKVVCTGMCGKVKVHR